MTGDTEKVQNYLNIYIKLCGKIFTGFARERSGSVEECLTQNREAAGLSLTGVTALWSLSKTHLFKLITGSTQEDPSLFN